MIIRSIVITLLLLFICRQVDAQHMVKGKIYEAGTDSVIIAVNVYNLNTKQSARSGIDGNYAIAAAEGERLVFSISGFKPDTVTVVYHMLLIQYDVTLYKQIVTLENVTVTSSYQADSLAR